MAGALASVFAVVRPIESDQPLPASLIIEDISLGIEKPTLEKLTPNLPSTHSYLIEETLRSGDSLGSLLSRMRIEDSAAERFLKARPDTRSLLRLSVPERFRVW